MLPRRFEDGQVAVNEDVRKIFVAAALLASRY
jgi:hypothetical protein